MQFTLGFSVVAFFKPFSIAGFLTKQLVVGKACALSMTHILHPSHFCCSFCSAKCSWRKRSERMSFPIYFFFLPMFSSFVSLPPGNVNNAQYWVCLFFPPISFLGVEKADFRSFPNLYGFFFCVLTKYSSLTRGNSVSCNSTPCFYTPPLGQGEKGFLPGSHQKINRGKNKRGDL